MDRIAKGAADGSTLFVVPPQIAINQFLYAKLQYDPEKDLLPISQISRFSNLLTIKKQLGGEIKSVKDLIDYAKKNPGKLNFASSGSGTNASTCRASCSRKRPGSTWCMWPIAARHRR